MSDYQATYGIRAHIPALDGATDKKALEFFREILGEPDEIDEDYKTVYSFYYEQYAGYGRKAKRIREYIPVAELDYEKDSKTNRWGIQKTFDESSGFESDGAYLSLDFLQTEANKMAEKFGIDPASVIVYSYTWYNGSDQPCVFEARNPKIEIEECDTTQA